MDLRIEKTKKNIINAFIELRSKKPLEKISVKELCELAMINKSTFYSHYEDIYALSESLEKELVHSIIVSLSHPEDIFEHPSQFLEELMLAYIAKSSLINIIFSGSRRSTLAYKIEQSIRDLVFEMHPEYEQDAIKNVLLSYSIHGSYHAITENSDYNPQTIISILAKILDLTEELYH